MNFDRPAPCADCPFLVTGGIRLRKERIGEIAQALLVEPGSAFPCHKTVNHGRRNRRTESACAGSLLFQLNVKSSTQWFQLASRIGGLNPARLKGDRRVFRSLAAWLRTSLD